MAMPTDDNEADGVIGGGVCRTSSCQYTGFKPDVRFVFEHMNLTILLQRRFRSQERFYEIIDFMESLILAQDERWRRA